MENLKNGTKIDYEGKKIFYRRNELHIIYEDGEESNLLKDYNLTILRDKFEILSEEDEEIDIDSINEFGTNGYEGYICISSDDSEKERELRKYIINNVKDIKILIKAVKQLNKKVGDKDE